MCASCPILVNITAKAFVFLFPLTSPRRLFFPQLNLGCGICMARKSRLRPIPQIVILQGIKFNFLQDNPRRTHDSHQN